MLDTIKQNLDAVASICKKYSVKRLELFGSAARDDFDPTTSDVDFFVEFLSDDWHHAADNWFGLQEDLERLLARKVDLVCIKKVWNPYFLKAANASKVPLYAA